MANILQLIYSAFFDSLTSKEAGIFHVWDEQDSYQLPLSQCYIQVATPLSDGPTPLLPLMTCSGLTHNETRREAGLTGIETYVAEIIHRLIPEHNDIGIGARRNDDRRILPGTTTTFKQ